MSVINVNNLTFCYDGSYDNIFENVSFSVDTDWKLGFIGRNGRGKTTFLNLLMGKYNYSGTIASSVVFDYFPFEVADVSRFTIDIAREVSRDVPDWKIKRELKLMNVSDDVMYRAFNTLSNGERTKILIASLFLRENNFLLIDEPTNHLDTEARERLSEYLNKKSGFILVSHDRSFIDSCCDHILSINRSTIEVKSGNFSSWQREKMRRDELERQQNERLKKDIERLNEASLRIASWSDKIEATKIGDGSCDRGNIGAKAAKMMRHSKAVESRIERSIEEKEKLMKDVEYEEWLKIRPLEYFSDRMIALNDVSLKYGERAVVNGISFDVRRGDRIALCGNNGCGKSSIIKLMLGELEPTGGEINVGSKLRVSYVPQDASFLRGYLKNYPSECAIDETLFFTILRKLDFKRVQFEKRMEELSEGQRKKVLLARSLCESAHVYIWDEPLNFIDVFSRIQLERLILESCPTMVFVEHDKAFVEKTATKRINL